MESSNFAQTCENEYIDIDYRHPTMNESYWKPPLYRHPPPFTLRKISWLQNKTKTDQPVPADAGVPADAVEKKTRIYSKNVIEDIYNLQDKDNITEESNKFDFMDSDSDVSVDSSTSNFSDLDEKSEDYCCICCCCTIKNKVEKRNI